MIDVLLVSATMAIAAYISYALWNSRRSEPGQIRRVIGVALFGVAGITLAKLAQLAVLVTAKDETAFIVRYVDISATIVVVVGISLLAISLLDMIMLGQYLWPKEDGRSAGWGLDQGDLGGSSFAPDMVPAILFRREAPLGDTTVSSTFLNNKIEDLLGFTLEEMQSDRHFMTWLMHPEDRQEFLQSDDRLSTAKSNAVFDLRFKHRNGDYRWIRTIMTRFDNRRGAFEQIVGCGVDITDLKEAENQLNSLLSTDPCSVVPEDEII